LQVKAGDWIAQNAANGAVGRILMRYAQAKGVNVVNFVRRADAAKDLASHGAAHVVVTDESGWEERARALTGGAGFARIVDSIAGAQSLVMQRLLAAGGMLVVFGGLSSGAMKLDPGLMIARELDVRGFWMTAWMGRSGAERVGAAMSAVVALAMKGELPLPVAGVYPLEKCGDALRAAEQSGRGGKVLFGA
jgi:NADPH2:quinone reductase